MRITKRKVRASFEDLNRGGWRSLIASRQDNSNAEQRTITYNDIANCLRANGALSATDNSICYYENTKTG